MTDMADEGEPVPPRGRSLRVRQTRVSYAEDEDEQMKTSEKKRGSKRKAEVNVESLYCQENIKVVPSSLETIFESPKKEQGRGRGRKSKVVDIVGETSSDVLLMGAKKIKRFCSFVSYYCPTKQKNKVRKDRAKKLKQVTGVKIPKGSISDEALKSVLGAISDDEDQFQSVPNKSFSTSACFYTGNVIKPDVEDSSVNEVIRNISSMQMVTDDNDEKVSNNIFGSLDDPLPIFEEKVGSQPRMSKEKRSRRRSSKYYGCLLPDPSLSADIDLTSATPLSTSAQANDCSLINESYLVTNTDEKLSDSSAKDSNSLILEDGIAFHTTPKKRNALVDEKIVKKVKVNGQQMTCKRQSESKEEQCQKKRGNLKIKQSKKNCGPSLKDNSDKSHALRCDVENSSVLANTFGDGKELMSQVNQYKGGCLQGKRRGKRRVSGIRRPLYRTIVEANSPEVLENDDHSLNDRESDGAHSEDILEESNHKLANRKTSPNMKYSGQLFSPTSPCTTQMAALTLHSDSDICSNRLEGKKAKSNTSRRGRCRRSDQFSVMKISKAENESNPLAFPRSSAGNVPSSDSSSAALFIKTTSEDRKDVNIKFGSKPESFQNHAAFSKKEFNGELTLPLPLQSGEFPAASHSKLDFVKDNLDVRNSNYPFDKDSVICKNIDSLSMNKLDLSIDMENF